ncbi:MAG TPA: cytochrome c biogenesis protein CcsA [Polyangiaceae bacterium]|nr:cytochrome c biogenesis protein CcsA [Polyangiaceae bacterium]
MRPRGLIVGGIAITALTFVALIFYVFLRVPEAQPQAGGLAQKIFYFHVPAATALYVCGGVCFLGSALYLYSPGERADAWAKAGAECATVFGGMVLVSGPLWAKKAWGVYWTWDPRLTSLLLSVLIYVALVVLRAFAGNGDAERKFAAAFGILGTAVLPIVHFSVQLWGGNHPKVLKANGGGGLEDPAMKLALGVGFIAMALLAALILTLRAQLALSQSRLLRAEELAPEPSVES